MTDSAEVAVVLCSAGPATYVSEQLAALAEQRTDRTWELVVVDNGLTPEGRERVAKGCAAIERSRVVAAPDRRGLSYARNVGVAAIESPLVLFCDDDDIVGSGWVQSLSAGLGRDTVVGGPLDASRINPPDSVRWRDVPPSDRLMTHLDLLPHAIGANMGVRTDAYRQVGGCDEAFVGGCEDIDLCWRVQQAGGTIGWVPDARVDYRTRSGIRAYARQQRAYGRTLVQLYAKHRPAGARKPNLRSFLLMVVRLVWGLRHLVLGGDDRGRWCGAAASFVGQVEGMIRFRTVYF